MIYRDTVLPMAVEMHGQEGFEMCKVSRLPDLHPIGEKLTVSWARNAHLFFIPFGTEESV
jgi:hypothetical protein